MTRDGVLLLALFASLFVILCLRSENSELRAELEGLKRTYAEAQAKAVEKSAKVNNEALAVREEKYGEVNEAGTEAAVSIATVKHTPEATNEVNPDGNLPLALSDALIVQQDRVCGGSVSNSATGTDLQPKAAAEAARQKGAANDRAAAK